MYLRNESTLSCLWRLFCIAWSCIACSIVYMTSSELSYFDLKIWKHDHPVLATSMLGRVDMLCYLIHASVASWYLTCCNSSWFSNSYLTWSKKLIKLLELCLKWNGKIQVGLLVALIELSGRLTLHLWEPGQGCAWLKWVL